MTQSTQGKIAVATLIMMGSIFLSKVLGVVRESTIAAIGGANTAVDAYKTAFVLPEILNHVLASGFLSVVFIPIFSRYLADDDEAGGWRIFSTILSVFGLVLMVLTAIAMLLTPSLIPLLAPGRDNPEFTALTVRMTRIILPAQLFFFVGSMLMAVQFAKKHFLLPAMAPLVYNACIISGGILLGPRLGMEGFSWGALIGAFFGSFLLQLPGAMRAGMRFCFSLQFKHPDLRRYILLTLPLMLGLTMTFSSEVFSKFFGSFLPAGAISWIDYAWRIVMMLIGFFGQAVGVASYPFLAQLIAEKRLADMNRLFNGTLRYLALVIPASVLFIVLRYEIIQILFQRLAFTKADTVQTALALSGMLAGAVAFTAQTVVNRGFYAMQNTLTPAVFGSIAVFLSLPFYWVGLKTLGVLGVGLAMSFSAILQVLVLYAVWNRRSGNEESRQVYIFYLKIMLLSLAMGVVLESAHAVAIGYVNTATYAGSIYLIILLSGLFFAIMALSVWLFKIEEARMVWRKFILFIAQKVKTP